MVPTIMLRFYMGFLEGFDAKLLRSLCKTGQYFCPIGAERDWLAKAAKAVFKPGAV